MKAIFKNRAWCAIAIVAVLGGCAAPPRMKDRSTDFYIPYVYFPTTNSGPVNWYSQFVRSISGSGADEVWVIPRNSERAAAFAAPMDSGTLLAKARGGRVPLPLSHTDVKASVAGFIGSVEVKQEFENPYAEKIEAIYVFPLPRNAAIDEFIMTIGKRRIRGIIRERKEAEAIYEEARRQGYKATLLTEERPNVFQQAIANIEPGNEIDVNIKYFQTLTYRDGWYRFIFPMVIASDAVYSASGEHSVADISLRVDVDAGAPIQELECKTHAVSKTVLSPQHVVVQLKPQDSVPDRNFVLRYRLAERQIQSSLLTHQDERGGFFSLMLFPPQAATLTNIKIDWGAMGVSEVIPANVPDLISGQPVILTGRFSGTTNAPIRLTGNSGGAPVQFEVSATSPAAISNNALPNLWARMKIAELASQLAYVPKPELVREIRQVALDFGILSPFTSFMAVDASEATEENNYKTVPVAAPSSGGM